MKAGSDLLLDTDVIIALFRRDEHVQRTLSEARKTFIPSVAAGELLLGALGSDRVEAETARVEAFFSTGDVLPCDVKTAYHYADIKHQLRRQGRLIPENDMWIAALARQYGFTLATRDAHYGWVEGIRIEPCWN